MRRQELREHVLAVQTDKADPGQVVEPDLVDLHTLRLRSQHLREGPLKPDRDIAETHGAMAVIEQRPCDDADRIREVDDPCAVGCTLADAVGDPEDDRDGA